MGTQVSGTLQIGLPLARSYPLEEIGGASRSIQLAIDPIGRLAVVSGDGYHVLNDATWIGMGGSDVPPTLSHVVTASDGTMYYGALADWGIAEIGPEGRIHARRLRPATCPEWVSSNRFTHIVAAAGGVCFGGLNGVVWWDRATNEQLFLPVGGFTGVFALGPDIFVSSHRDGLQRLNPRERRLETSPDPAVQTAVADATVALAPHKVLISTVGRSLLVFDGKSVVAWHGAFHPRVPARAPLMRRLPDGGIVMAIDGHGLFLLTDEGELRMSLTSAEYHRIQDITANEPGVLWIATEQAVQRLLYGDPVTVVDQRLGISIRWPNVIQWDGRTLVATSGILYEAVGTADEIGRRFEPIRGQPQFGAWTLAVAGPHLLIGNAGGVYLRQGEHFIQVLSGLNVHQLIMVGTDFCYAIGSSEIAAVRLVDGRWIEAAPRVPGAGFPAVAHRVANSAWIEIGVNHAARVSFREGALHVRVFDEFPGEGDRWPNIGSIGDIAVLNGGPAGVLFFDEATGELSDSPEIRRLMDSAPYPVQRLSMDASGTIWASHTQGVFLAHRDPSAPCGFRFDTSTLSNLRDFQPRVHLLDSGVSAISTERTLYFVGGRDATRLSHGRRPTLVSITDRRNGTELYSPTHALHPVSTFRYAQNHLLFRFFSGSYLSIRPPEYEFLVSRDSTVWSVRGSDSHLDLRDLREGHYRLTAQLFDGALPAGPPLVVAFAVSPPWYRSPFAYAAYAMVAALATFGLLRWTGARIRRRNTFLEDLVDKRTAELRTTMSRLSEETRNTAILAERDRLAGELHDSVQQGLSGVMLQLGATLKLPDLRPDVTSRLEVARNMVSFTRHEVQQAVWDLESKLLDGAGLAEALRKLAALIGSGAPAMHVETTGSDDGIPMPVRHQLLRIAQEAITNAVRHGNAGQVVIRIAVTAEATTLEISDDGRGFSPDDALARHAGHFGLRGMRARASRIGADLQIVSAPEAGTTIRVTLRSSLDAALAHADPK